MKTSFLHGLLILFITIVIFLLSIVNNSINYHVYLDQNNLFIKTLDHIISVPTDRPIDEISVNLDPEERFSTPQILIKDKGFIINNLHFIDLLLSRQRPSEIKYRQLVNTSANYIHFNPFRSSLIINQTGLAYRLKVNIPDATLEFWQENNKLDHFPIKVPWLRLAGFPLLSSLMLTTILYCGLFLSGLGLAKRANSIRVTEKENGVERAVGRSLPLIILISGIILVGFIFIKVFKVMPGFGDEMNYLFQAKIFASGKVFIKEPLNPEFFRISWMDIFGNDGKLWNFHPPGNSFILTIGQFLKIPWITVPVVGGLILMTQFLLANELFGNKTIALLHIIIIGTSHYFLSLASSFMAHAPSLLFISLFYLFVVKLIKKKNQKYLMFAAASIAFAFIIRPLSSILSVIIPLMAIIIFLLRQKKINYFYLFGSLFIGLSIASIIFIYTYLVSGKLTLPYFIKGPEANQTLSVRSEKNWDYKLSNLYRNTNEFQNRIHGFGYFVNFAFFFLPLLTIIKNKKRWWILSGYFSFFPYLIVHSFLHWYGWKWEPRMIYDISFLFFLLTIYGLWIFYRNIKSIRILKYFSIIILISSFLYLAKTDLPYRFTNEYKNYNFQPAGVREAIAKNHISDAIIFFADEYVFGPYFPENTITFDGKIIYAIDQGEKNCVLIKKYPNRDVYFSPDGQIIISLKKQCT